ncbi:MAG: indole-3-glycerol phosphate synthase TrpC [Alphaproteobacteria bacterium]|nr:indole-3-glycerol phosphate synthase TrpC [Alphaproteobacteria bacterium]
MSSVLDEICARKVLHVATRKEAVSQAKIEKCAADAPKARGFIDALRRKNGPALIAEIKKASPSKGLIRVDFDPVRIACIYEENGASCISVLTDEPYFQGHDDYLRAVREVVNLPLLRKDFMLEPYQIYESRALGADCVLLIMAALGDSQARILYDLAVSLNMDVLVEIHDAQELKRALKLSPAMIGVNNRNLKTLAVDVQTSHDLASRIPDAALRVAESGISDPQTVESLHKDGYKAFLIGESLMCADDIAASIAALRFS